MLNLFDYIKFYADFHKIEKYTLKSKYFSINDILKTQKFSGGVAFFYEVFAAGEIANISDLNKNFLTISTPTDFFNFNDLIEVEDFGTLQQVKSNFVFTADNIINFDLKQGTEDALFQQVYNFNAKYIYLTPLQVKKDDTDEQEKKKINITATF